MKKLPNLELIQTKFKGNTIVVTEYGKSLLDRAIFTEMELDEYIDIANQNTRNLFMITSEICSYSIDKYSEYNGRIWGVILLCSIDNVLLGVQYIDEELEAIDDEIDEYIAEQATVEYQQKREQRQKEIDENRNQLKDLLLADTNFKALTNEPSRYEYVKTNYNELMHKADAFFKGDFRTFYSLYIKG